MIYSEQTDEILVGLTLAGKQAAYEALVLRYQKAVLASAYAVVRNSYMAEDAAQDAFVSAWMKLALLREPSKFGAWVCRIAGNCAKNMLARVREYMDFDVLLRYEHDHAASVEGLLVPETDERTESLHDSIGRLPDKVKQVIYLHYFEGLSVAEIAERMLIPAGTVKWQLHEGRQKIRKDLCAMNERENDTLAEKVMKKVEELQLMLLNNDRSGIEAAYRALLPEVENLPESKEQQYALADVLKIGWWCVKSVQSDEYLARLRDAAERGHNDQVMEAIAEIEHGKLSGDALIEFIRDKQIPRLEKGGYRLALGCAWFWLGAAYIKEKKDIENCLAANEKVLEILNPEDVYYANALAVKKAVQTFRERRGDLPEDRYHFHAYAEMYRYIDGELRFVSQPGYGIGEYDVWDFWDSLYIFGKMAVGVCDGYLPPHGLNLGKTYTATDGKSTLTFEKNGLTVETPAGIFENCQLWSVDTEYSTRRTYLKEGVGVIRQELRNRGIDNTVTHLIAYEVTGEGLLPFTAGNKWSYAVENLSHTVDCEITAEVVCNNGETVTVAHNWHQIKRCYDENNWNEMMLQMRREYAYEDETKPNESHLRDMTHVIERAEALAKTPLELAHTRAACSVMRRIMDTDEEFNPNRTMSGHWNFFNRSLIIERDGKITLEDGWEYDFEWKDIGHWSDERFALLYNDIYEMFAESLHDCLWSDDWASGTHVIEWKDGYRDTPIKTTLTAEPAGEISTAAGTFADCIRLTLDTEGKTNGLAYRGGHKEYWLAPGVGIVRVISTYPHNDKLTATYELTSYTGTGDGYMPLPDGMHRRFDGIGFKDNFLGWADYTVSGNCLFADRGGVRVL